MNKKLSVIIGIIILTVVLFSIKDQQQTPAPNSKINVITSFYPLYFFASQIMGDEANVTNITPAGAEPHDYEPTAADIARIEKSSILILNGGQLEPWGDKITNDLKDTNVTVITAGEHLFSNEMKDPHIWLDPVFAQKMVDSIASAAEKKDPVHADLYRVNAKKLNDQLLAIDTDYKTHLIHCQQHDIVTSHAAFAYLADRYHLNQIAISGLSPDEEPAPSRLAEVARLVKEKHIKYIFFESLVNPKLSETIAYETGAQTLVLDPIEGITDQDLQKGETYITHMQENLKHLQIALSCQ
jgi:zinc transport system substrate-binding protein